MTTTPPIRGPARQHRQHRGGRRWRQLLRRQYRQPGDLHRLTRNPQNNNRVRGLARAISRAIFSHDDRVRRLQHRTRRIQPRAQRHALRPRQPRRHHQHQLIQPTLKNAATVELSVDDQVQPAACSTSIACSSRAASACASPDSTTRAVRAESLTSAIGGSTPR